MIGSDGEQLGVMSKQEALAKADASNLDLVLISPNSNPPVGKIMDYGKYKYEKQKKKKKKKKKKGFKKKRKKNKKN